MPWLLSISDGFPGLLSLLSRSGELRVAGEYLREPGTLHAVLEAERLHHFVYLLFGDASEAPGELRDQRLGDEDVAHELLYVSLGAEGERGVVRELPLEEAFDRLHHVPDVLVGRAPGVGAEADLLLQDGPYALQVGGVR